MFFSHHKLNTLRASGSWSQIHLTLVILLFSLQTFAVITEPEGSSPLEPMIVNTQTEDCPEKCVKSGRCDKLCRSRTAAEKQMIDKILSVYAQSIKASEPAQIVAIDQTRFCAKEVISFKSPSGLVLSLPNAQGFKGALATHDICHVANGYTIPPTPPNRPHDPISGSSSDACYNYTYTLYPESSYSTPVLTGPVQFQCVEDEKTKTMSWKMISGCTVSIASSLVQPVRSVLNSSVQHSCFQNPEPSECFQDVTTTVRMCQPGEYGGCWEEQTTTNQRVPCQAAPTCAEGMLAQVDTNYRWVCSPDPCYPNGCASPPAQEVNINQ